MPLAGRDARFQPVWVDDVAAAIVACLDRRSTIGQTIECAGPAVFTLGELVALAGRWAGHERRQFGLPESLGRLQAGVLERLPGEPLMSRDNLLSMRVPNVASGSLPGLESLGIQPTDIRSVMPAVLGSTSGPARLNRLRAPQREHGRRVIAAERDDEHGPLRLAIGNKNYSSWSMRPWVLMKQTGIDFDEVMLRFDGFDADSQFKRAQSPATVRPAACRCCSTASWRSGTRWRSPSTWPNRSRNRRCGRTQRAARARARSVCAEMHSGFGALREHFPMNIEASLPEVGERVLREQRRRARRPGAHRLDVAVGCSTRAAARCCSAASRSPTPSSRRS